MTQTASSPQFKALAWTLLLVIAALTTGTAATVYVSGDAARRINISEINRSLRTHPNARYEALDRAHRQIDAARLLMDSVLAPLGVSHDLDSISLRRMVALTSRSTRPHANVWIAVGDAPQPGDSTNLQLFRTWARATRLPNFWGYRVGFDGVHTFNDLPIRSMQVLKRFVIANETSADSALQRGDVATAMIRARENIGAARQLVDQPSTMDVLVGRVLLQRGARLLARVANASHDSLAHTAALRLDTVAQIVLRRFEFQRAIALGVDASDQRLRALAADRTLHPALRLNALDGEVRGACLRSDEMLSGPSDARRATLETLLIAVADIPRASELAPLYRQSLEQFATPAHVDFVDSDLRGLDKFVSNFRWIIPKIIRDRVRWCQVIQ